MDLKALKTLRLSCKSVECIETILFYSVCEGQCEHVREKSREKNPDTTDSKNGMHAFAALKNE